MMSRPAAFAALVAAALALAQPAAAQQDQPSLSPAQLALFETPHLASVRTPQDLAYAFRREEEGRAPVEDRITMEVRAVHGDGGHDVYPEFLTGERRLPYPPALGFRGNPLLMFALDRDTRELAAATGGSASWFRNRIRRAFAEGATLRETRLGTAPAVEIEIQPFQGEPRARRYQERRYRFLLSETVPGGIAEIRTVLPAGDGQGRVEESITFAGSQPR
jgi:hypothetical protein